MNRPFPFPNFVRGVNRSIDVDTFTVRGDHNLTNKDRVYGQFLFQNEDAPSPSVIPLSGTNLKQNGRLASLQWTHIFSPRTLNEARVGYNRLLYLNGFETAFGSINYWREAGLRNLRDDPGYYALPAISLGSGYTGIGTGRRSRSSTSPTSSTTSRTSHSPADGTA